MELDTNKFDKEFSICSKTKIWLYKLSDMYWEELKKLFKKKSFYISSSIKPAIYQNDIVIIYQKHIITTKCGFVAICQIKSNIKNNEKNIKIFNDITMNKYYCDIDKLYILNELCKVSYINNISKLDNNNIFKKSKISNMLKNKANITQFDNDIGKNIINIITRKNNQYTKSNDKSFKNNIEISYDTENNNKFIIQGQIPILMIPCINFNWEKDTKNTVQDFKNHYKYCDKCDKTDNNNISIVSIFDNSEIFCQELDNIHKIDKYLEYYLNLQKYSSKSEKQNNYIRIFRINKRGHIYHKCLLIIW